MSVAQYYYWGVNLLIAGLQKLYYFGFDPAVKPRALGELTMLAADLSVARA